MNVKKRRSQAECVSNNFLDDMSIATMMVETANWAILCITKMSAERKGRLPTVKMKPRQKYVRGYVMGTLFTSKNAKIL